jgi:hypothetical protein
MRLPTSPKAWVSIVYRPVRRSNSSGCDVIDLASRVMARPKTMPL